MVGKWWRGRGLSPRGPRRHRGRLLLGRHEEVRSDNNEFRCRPFRPARVARVVKSADVYPSPPSLPPRPFDRFSSTAMWTIVSNFYCANVPVSHRVSQSLRLIRNDEERGRGTLPHATRSHPSLAYRQIAKDNDDDCINAITTLIKYSHITDVTNHWQRDKNYLEFCTELMQF